jgi:hypothetical protein
MNLELLPHIAALLGNTGGMGQPQAAPQEPEQPDIVVPGNDLPRPKRRLGLVHGGTFQMGRTGGNILGLLGDAFRAQAGLDPAYAPRLQQARDSEALENYSSDPLAALQQLTMTNPGAALPAFNQYYDNQRQDKATNSLIADRTDAREDSARNAAASILYASNEKTFPAALARAKAFAERRGVDTSDFPSTFEDAKSWGRGSVPVDKQENLDALTEYRTSETARKAAADAARDRYYNSNVGERRRHNQVAETVAERRARTAEQRAGTYAESVGKAPDRSKWTQPSGKGSGNGSNGLVYSFENGKVVKRLNGQVVQ